ncbi:MAG: hypothetical protein JWO54_514, partial [Candidatus Saccharibacteria bacterium]|nr:hypothetical protein [Candidatus Saccharibacteria bacterium]
MPQETNDVLQLAVYYEYEKNNLWHICPSR